VVLVVLLLASLAVVPLAAASEPKIDLYPTGQDEDFNSIAVAPDGTVWWSGGNAIGELNPAAASPGTSDGISSYSPDVGGEASTPTAITAAPDGALWFSERNGPDRGIDKLTPEKGDEITLVHASDFAGQALAFSPLDGDLWYTGLTDDVLYRLTADADPPYSEVTSTGAYQHSGESFGVTVDPSGNVWFTESGGAIGEIKTGTTTITEYPIPSSGAEPTGITVDQAGDIWFTERKADKIGELVPSQTAEGTSAGISEYEVPVPEYVTEKPEPNGITTAPDGTLWFTDQLGTGVSESTANQIGKIVPASGGKAVFTMIETPDHKGAEFVAADKQGNIWYLSGPFTFPSEIGEVVDASPPSGEQTKSSEEGESSKGSGTSGGATTGTGSTTGAPSTASSASSTATTTVVTGVTTTVHAAPPVVRPEGLAENLQCFGPATQPCEVVLNLETNEYYYNAGFPVKLAHAARARKLHHRKVIVGHLLVKMTGGQSREVTVSLDSKGRKLLAKFHRLPATLTVTESSGAGKPATVAKSSVTFKYVKRRSQKHR
jgi:streptogramin lyase